MIRSIYTIFLLSLCLTSCYKDSITVDESEIVIPPSEEVEVYQVQGLVQDVNGGVIPNIKVQLIADNEILDERVSDQDGTFQFNDLFNDTEYIVATQSNQYPTIISSLNAATESIELSLLNNQENTFPFQVDNLDPTVDEIVIFNGSVESNSEVNTRIHVLGESFGWYNYGILNNSNNFNIPVKKDAVFDVYIENECGLQRIENYGPFSTSNPNELIELEQEISSFTISGMVTDCEGEPIQEGEIFIGTNGNISYQTTIINGFYEQEIQGCNVSEIVVFTNIASTINPFPTFITDLQTELELDFEICDSIFSDGFMELRINNEDIQLSEIYVANEWLDWQGTYSYNIHPYIYTETDLDFSLVQSIDGEFELIHLEIFKDMFHYYSINEDDATIEVIVNDEYIEGSISGEIIDISSQSIEDYSIEFKVLKF